MIENDKLLDLIETAFPVQPQPTAFFSADGIEALNHDVPQELSRRIAGRPWTEVTLMDWRMIGTSPVIARRYLEPASFMYYVPSIIFGTSQQIEFIDFALEGIIPHNKHNSPVANGGRNSQGALLRISGWPSPRFFHTFGLCFGIGLVLQTSLY